MKRRHLIVIFIATVFVGCDKPQPSSVAPLKPTLVSVVSTYQENPFTFNVDAKKTDVYVFSETASIEFDTVVYNIMYRRLLYAPSELPLIHSNYDTIHNIKLHPGNYRILIDNIFFIASPSPWDSVQEYDTLRWYHLRECSVTDTIGFMVADTFFRKEFYIGNN